MLLDTQGYLFVNKIGDSNLLFDHPDIVSILENQ
jgi:hypothetical protein